MLLKLSEIHVNPEHQARTAMDTAVIKEYAEAYRSGEKLPPLQVCGTGTDYWLWDGFHRYQGALAAGLESVEVELRPGTATDAAWLACSANVGHGLRRTNADKRRAVELALGLHPEMSLGAIAQHCRVGVDLVRTVRQGMVAGGRFQPPDRVVGTDRKGYPATAPAIPDIPPPPFDYGPPPKDPLDGITGLLPEDHPLLEFPPKDAVAAPAPMDIPPVPPFPVPALAAPPPIPPPPVPVPARSAAPVAPKAVVDCIGRPVPAHLQALWLRRHEVQDMMTTLGRFRGTMQRAIDSKDPLFATCSCNQVMSELKLAHDGLKGTLPYCVCPYCHGVQGAMANCKSCHGLGIIAEFRWTTCVPESLKRVILQQAKKG